MEDLTKLSDEELMARMEPLIRQLQPLLREFGWRRDAENPAFRAVLDHSSVQVEPK